MTVILNQAAGRKEDDPTEAVRAAFRRGGEEPEIVPTEGAAALRAAIDRAMQGPGEIVAAGGGDGTLSTLAGEVAGTGKTMGVLPLGTLNHFAKDLGLPLDVEGAARVIAQGRTVAVDVGEVNGRVFLNNSSLGIYPYVVQRREAQQARLGRGKWPAFARAALDALRRYPFLRLRLTVGGRQIERETAFLFIGNNAYEFGGWKTGKRARLDGACLGVCLAHRTGRLGLLRLAVRALIGRLAPADGFEMFCAEEVVVESRRRHLPVATDGEVTRMRGPLHYRIRPGALKVRVPEAQP